MLSPRSAHIAHRSLISVTGPQAAQFLNGIVAMGPPSPPAGGFFTTFLHPQGRVLYDAFVYRQQSSQDVEDGYIVDIDSRPSGAPSLLSLLKRYVLRSKVKVNDVSDHWDVWAVWGTESGPDDRKWRWSRSGAVEPVWDSALSPWGNDSIGFSILDRRAHGMGKRLLVRKGDIPLEASTHDVATLEAYNVHRISHGVPEGVVDIPPLQAFPMESNLDVLGGIDFRKGCYIGQELTARTYHTGVVRKRILPVKFHPLQRPQTGLNEPPSPVLRPGLNIRMVDLVASGGKTIRPRGTGHLLSSVGNIGLALLRLEHVGNVEQGHAKFEIDVGDEDQEKQSWGLTHSWPIGWPVPGSNEVS